MSRVIAAFAQFFDGTGAPLENGWLTFYETSTNNTYKPTYADADQTIANENPLQLDAEGRCPNVFGQGLYRVVLSENNPVTNVPGAMIQTFDPVTAQYVNTGNGSGNFGNFDIAEIYQVGQVVLYTGIYYRSLVANNVGYQPDLNTDKWEVIEFLRYWNADVTYLDGNPVFYESELYFSLSDNNIGNQPDINPVWWRSTKSTVVNFEWSAIEVYEIGNIVYYSGVYYRSITGSNVNNQPDINLDNWEIIEFLRIWNDAVDYNTNDLVIYSGDIYVSLTSPNINQQPDVSPSYWRLYPFSNWTESGTALVPVVSGYNLGSTSNLIGNFYQGNSSIHFFGDTQQASIYHDLTDLYIEETSGDLIIGTESPGTGSIFFKTAGVNKWSIAAQGRLIPESNNLYDIGSASRNVMDFFQGDNANHYFGNLQDVSLFFDGTDFNFSIGSNIWKLLSTGTLEPQIDAGFDVGSALKRVKRLFISDNPTTDDEAIRLGYYSTNIEIITKVRDYVQNGFQLVWQRATSQTTSGIESDDRSNNTHLTTTKTHSRQAFTYGQTDVPNNPLYYSRTVVTTGSTASSYCIKFYRIIGVEKLSGQTVFLTFWAKSDAAKPIATEFIQNFGTGGSTAITGIGVTTHNLLTGWQRFDVAISLPSISGKTIGTNDVLQINFWFDAGSDFDSRTNSLGNQSGTFDIHGVRLLNSPYFVDLPVKNFEETLIDCLPYYEKSWNYEIAVGTVTNQGTQSFHARSGTAQYLTGNYKASKVITPSLVIYSPITGAAGYIRNQSTLTDILINSISNQGKNSHGIFTLASAQTAGEALYYHFTADTGF